MNQFLVGCQMIIWLIVPEKRGNNFFETILVSAGQNIRFLCFRAGCAEKLPTEAVGEV